MFNHEQETQLSGVPDQLLQRSVTLILYLFTRYNLLIIQQTLLVLVMEFSPF